MDGGPQELFTAMPWSGYLNIMVLNSYDDQLSLKAMANLYLGPEGRTVNSRQNCEAVAGVFLGHVSEERKIGRYPCLLGR